jgi:hypothetical protein
MRTLALLAALLLLSGCLLPRPPGESTVKKAAWLDEELELNAMNKGQLVVPPGGASPGPHVVWKPSGRNLVFVAADDEVQSRFERPIMEAYKSDRPLRLEEVSWWLYASRIRELYDLVVRVPYDRFHKGSLVRALELMEEQGKPYDLVLLTHGVPNHLVTSPGYPLFSWKDLGALKGRLRGLNVVFMQACFGDTLVPDWHAAGARAVVSYKGLNRNFFYLEFFLDNYEDRPGDVAWAHRKTNSEIARKLRGDKLYKAIISRMGLTLDEYLANAPNPSLSISP